jgi:hypothetical protein
MPAPKSFLRQQAQFNLDPRKAYSKDDMGHDGHIKVRINHIIVKSSEKEQMLEPKKEEPKVKPTVVEKSTPTVPSDSKSESDKVSTVKPTVEEKKVETSTTSQVTGDKASGESTVDSKENTVVKVGSVVTVKPV